MPLPHFLVGTGALVAVAALGAACAPQVPATFPPASPLSASAPAAASAPAGEPQVCPMHPEVQAQGPASCRKCGMALKPKSSIGPGKDGHEGHQHH